MRDLDEPVPGIPRGRRVRLARELRGLTQGEVVGRMPEPITAAALSQIESDRVRPTAETLRGLATALAVPVGYFSVQEDASGDAPLAYFRDLRATPVLERRRAAALAYLLNDLVAAIEHHVLLPALAVPRRTVGPGQQREAIEEATLAVRTEWGLGADPIEHMVRSMERHGIPVARLSIGHRHVDAFSVAFARRPIVLLTEDKSNYVRSRFDAAHELGHIVMHEARPDRDRSVELQAHQFASTLLLPTAAARAELPRRLDNQGWIRLAGLKRRWGLSMAALVRRARDLRMLSEDDYRNAMKFMSARGWRTQEPGDRELGPPESPLLLERALKTIEVRGGVRMDDLIRAAQLPLEDAMDLLRTSRDQRPTIEL